MKFHCIWAHFFLWVWTSFRSLRWTADCTILDLVRWEEVILTFCWCQKTNSHLFCSSKHLEVPGRTNQDLEYNFLLVYFSFLFRNLLHSLHYIKKHLLFFGPFVFYNLIKMVDRPWRFFGISGSLSISKAISAFEVDGSRKMNGSVRVWLVEVGPEFLPFGGNNHFLLFFLDRQKCTKLSAFLYLPGPGVEDRF